MRPRKDSTKALERLFRRSPVVDLDRLCRTLKTDSRMSVFRRLKDLDYLSSYTHAGGYYTLAEIPQFDEHGLWFVQGVGFSRAGTLKNTLRELIEDAEAGRTHPELRQLLGVRVHNTLLDLVHETQIARERIERMYLYVSAESKRASRQMSRRRELLAAAQTEPLPLPAVTVIEILAEAIHIGKVRLVPAQVVKQLTARGIVVTAQQVEDVFLRYELGPEKKGD